MSDTKTIAEIEARHDELEKRTFRYEDFRWAHEDRATLLAIVREAYEVADVREGDTLAGKIQEYLSDRDFLARQNQTLKKREAVLRRSLEAVCDWGDAARKALAGNPT